MRFEFGGTIIATPTSLFSAEISNIWMIYAVSKLNASEIHTFTICPALRNETAAARPPSPAPTIATFKGQEIESTIGEDIIGEFLTVERHVICLPIAWFGFNKGCGRRPVRRCRDHRC
jgi:hypothetical protein